MITPVSPRQLAAVTAWFEESFRTRGEMGASVSIWQEGREILSLGHGAFFALGGYAMGRYGPPRRHLPRCAA